MSHFPVHTMDTAPGLPRPSLQSLGTAFGFIPNIAGTMATSSVLIGSLVELFGSVHGGNFSELQIQVLLLTNAAEWAVAFHSTLALKEGLSSSDVDAIRSRGLPSEPKLAALSRLARTLIETRGKLSPSDHDAFLRAGFLPENLLEVALAIRDEVLDLERAGAAIVQIDEAALREGLPLRRTDWQVYLNWAVECFRLTSSGVRDDTQLHTHMCYSEFNDISGAVGAMDADVISIETSRSKMELLSAFVERDYPNEIGPGVWDIHSPRVPSTEEMVQLLGRAREGLSAEQLWVNPDCGLRTRGWAEVSPAIANMVASARAMRSAI